MFNVHNTDLMLCCQGQPLSGLLSCQEGNGNLLLREWKTALKKGYNLKKMLENHNRSI